jgi:hypothetical protein
MKGDLTISAWLFTVLVLLAIVVIGLLVTQCIPGDPNADYSPYWR